MIMDKFNCKYCGKEVVLENDIDLGIRRDDEEIDNACSECYQSISLPIQQIKEQMQSELYEIQGNYLG